MQATHAVAMCSHVSLARAPCVPWRYWLWVTAKLVRLLQGHITGIISLFVAFVNNTSIKISVIGIRSIDYCRTVNFFLQYQWHTGFSYTTLILLGRMCQPKPNANLNRPTLHLSIALVLAPYPAHNYHGSLLLLGT